jgi:hypothetical protein
MDRTYSPLTGLAEATLACANEDLPTELVLPTTAAIQSHPDLPLWTRMGEEGRPGIHKPTTMLARLCNPEPPRQIISYCDQLCRLHDATIRVDLPDRRIFLSPIETILNTKYNFRLLVWTASGLVMLPPSSSASDIARTLVAHLRDCEHLAEAWQERRRQIERTIEHRIKSGRRQVRFLQSSFANSYARSPLGVEAGKLLDRIDTLEKLLKEMVRA